jgi:hypothetical protein
MIATERHSDATVSRLSLGIKGRDADCGLRIDRREIGPSSIPVFNITTALTGVLGRINEFTQVMLRIKYVCNGHAGPLTKTSRHPVSADKKFIYYSCRDINVQRRTTIQHIAGEILFN